LSPEQPARSAGPSWICCRQPANRSARWLATPPRRPPAPPGVEVVVGDLARPETISSARRGVTSLFVHPRAVGQAAPRLLGLAARHGVSNVAVLAALNVDDDPSMQPLRLNGDRNKEVEGAVTSSGLRWVSVRPGSFAASTLTMFAAQVRHGDVIRGPYAGFADAPIHEIDIAAVLLDAALAGQKISITGRPQSLTHEQMVTTIGEVIGRPLSSVRRAASRQRLRPSIWRLEGAATTGLHQRL
jgi:uncharacterized protein YbjT (DUF2867 family)